MPNYALNSSELADSEQIELLAVRMRAGDRDAAAEFVTRFGPFIRRRLHGKLGSSMRRIFDSQDILSTLCRRLDVCIRGGSFRAASANELWMVVLKMADNSLIEKARVFRSLEAKEGEDSPLAQRLLQRLRDAELVREDGPLLEIDHALQALSDRGDREVLSLWLMGLNHAAIANSVGMAPTAVRKRWQKIRDVLRERYKSEAF
jgi:DNA-directed RNA polymerase specialized sigma24 family protein